MGAGGPSVSLFRVGRLVKLARVVRLFQSALFKDLFPMVLGLVEGVQTLFWSLLLYLLVVYVVALICRSTLATTNSDVVNDHFNSVSRSFFTVFRCSFGDCSTKTGVPLFEQLDGPVDYYTHASYMFVLFVITVGISNVIAAIFVESAMQSANKSEAAKRAERLTNE